MRKAVLCDRIETVRVLLEHGADLEARDRVSAGRCPPGNRLAFARLTSLDTFARVGQGEERTCPVGQPKCQQAQLMSRTVNHGSASWSQAGETLLMRASRLHRPDVARLLLDAGADVDAKDRVSLSRRRLPGLVVGWLSWSLGGRPFTPPSSCSVGGHKPFI